MPKKHQEVKPLEGWMTLPEVAEYMGLSRQYVHRMASKWFIGLRRIGSVLIVQEEEVRHLTEHKG